MGLRKLRGAGSGWCGSAAEVLESHWLWADVQVEGGVEQMRGAKGGMVPLVGAGSRRVKRALN
jgi:hypothetical protein